MTSLDFFCCRLPCVMCMSLHWWLNTCGEKVSRDIRIILLSFRLLVIEVNLFIMALYYY